jgi:translation initiation factor 3 subunit G
MSTTIKKKQWADQEDDETAELNVPKEEQFQQDDGVILKKITTYTLNEKGQRIKTVKTIKSFKTKMRINKQIEKRRQWKKFGEPASSKGPEPGITTLADEVTLDLSLAHGLAQKEAEKPQKSLDMTPNIVCRNCGRTGHWTIKCPYGKMEKPQNVPEALRAHPSASSEGSAAPSSPALSSSKPGAYRIPALRGASSRSDQQEPSSPRWSQRGEEYPTLRVTNLSEDTRESDLNDLFSPFGHIHRIYLAKNPNQTCKGFAFVSFIRQKEAQQALEKLNGHGLNHLIIRIEWAERQNK